MDRVAAEVAKEIGVLLQHDDVEAGAREQVAEHDAGRPAARDAALAPYFSQRSHGALEQRRLDGGEAAAVVAGRAEPPEASRCSAVA